MGSSAKMVFFVLTAGLFLAAQANAQTMYSWTDENGVVHFSDVQPQGQQAQEEQIPMDERAAAASPYASPVDTGPSVAEQKRQELASKSEQARAKQAKNSAQCSAWKSEVAQLEPNRRVFSTNDQGETERMDDVVRTDRVAELKKQIAQNCN